MGYRKPQYEQFDNFLMSHNIAWKIILEHSRYFIPIIFVVTLSSFISTKFTSSIDYGIYQYEYGFAIIAEYIISKLIFLWLISFLALITNDFLYHRDIDYKNVATKSIKNLPKLISVSLFALIVYFILSLLILLVTSLAYNVSEGVAIFQSILMAATLTIMWLRYCFVFQIATLEGKHWYSAFKSSLHYVVGHQIRLFLSTALLGLLYLPGLFGLYFLSNKISNILISFSVNFFWKLYVTFFLIWLTIFYIQVRNKLNGDEFFLERFYNSNIKVEIDFEKYKNLIIIFVFSVLLLAIGIRVDK